MATRKVTIHDRCTTAGCGRVLHSIAEGERGTCSGCWLKSVPQEKKKAVRRLISVMLNETTENERSSAVDEVLRHFAQNDTPRK